MKNNYSEGPEYIHPLIEHRADPYILKHSDGNYYFTATVPEYDRIELRKSSDISGLIEAEPKVIWKKHKTGIMGAHIWAPELHYIDGKWYIYFAAGEAENVWNIRIFVLENSNADPLDGEWIEKGQIKNDWESFSLDATTFEHKGFRYLIWAQYDNETPACSNLYIAAMENPWTLSGKQIKISGPEYEWERVGHNVNEGPAVLKRGSKIFISYSASSTDYHYCMGLLEASQDSNLLDPCSWKKSPVPAFETCEENKQFGPGHNSFTVSEDGKYDLLVYHSRNYKEIEGEPLYDPNRHTHVQAFGWNDDGTPDFGVPRK